MIRNLLKSKIHRATITEANISYEGSITIDPLLMEAADILSFEQVHVLDINNGERFLTYAIPGQRGAGQVCVNGAAARLVSEGDTVIILTYASLTEEETATHKPTLVYVDSDNRITRVAEEIAI